MRVAVVVSAFAVVAAGCDDCVEEPVVSAEGEGDVVPLEGEGDDVGEGEGDDVGEGEGDDVGEGEGDCDVADLQDSGDGSKPRALLIAFPFGADGGRGDVVRSYVVGVDGSVGAEADRINVGFVPDRIAFLPSGTIAVVAGESFAPPGGGVRPPDQAVALDVSDPDNLRVLDAIDLGVYGVNDIVASRSVRGGGVVVYVVNFDSGTGSTPGGVQVVTVGCDGRLTHDVDASLDLRLASSMALLPDDRALLVGGQASFGTPDVNDTRLLTLAGGAVVDAFQFNLWSDDVNTDRVDVSADGSFAVVANASIFGDEANVTKVFDIDGDAVTLRGELRNVAGTQVVIAPDATVAVVSNFEDNALHVLDVSGPGDPTAVRTLTGLGLADHLAVITHGALAGRVYVPVTGGGVGSGSTVVAVAVGGGDAVVVGTVADLGDNTEDLPEAIAIAP